MKQFRITVINDKGADHLPEVRSHVFSGSRATMLAHSLIMWPCGMDEDAAAPHTGLRNFMRLAPISARHSYTSSLRDWTIRVERVQ